MKPMTYRFRRHALALALASFAAPLHGCAPPPEGDDEADDDAELEVTTQAAIDPVGAFVLAKGAEKLATAFLDKMMAEMFAPTEKETVVDVLPILGGLVQNLRIEAANVNWLQVQLANQDTALVPALTAVEQARRLVAQGLPIPQGGSIDFESGKAWKAYGSNLLFLRNADYIGCSRANLQGVDVNTPGLWPCIISARPYTENNGVMSYDWRLTGEAMLRVIADRIAVIAAMNPVFHRGNAFDPELLSMRDMLRGHRNRVSDGITCAHRDVLLTFGGKFPPTGARERYIACADIHTNQGLVRRQAPNADGFTFNEAATASTKGALRAQLAAKVPFAQMDSIIRALEWYANPTSTVSRLHGAVSNDVLVGWPAANATDGLASTSYSSTIFPSSVNNRGTFIAAWTGTSQPLSINQIHLTARTWNGVTQAFPARYFVWITAPDNSAWLPMGYFTTQPDHTGVARIVLNGLHDTFGVYVWPETLGRDSYGGHYFQIADMSVAKQF